jgi:peptide/nickel transport system permease protein
MSPLTIMIAQRVGFGILTIFLISILIFVSVEALPGDFAESVLGQAATPEAVAAIRQKLHLDVPASERYLDWIGGFFHGDLGQSLANRRPVADLIFWRLQNTFFLAATAAFIAVPTAVGLGLLAALYRDSLFDRTASTTALAAVSLPDFFIAYILIAVFAVTLGLFPAITHIGPHTSFGERIHATLLPAFTLTLLVLAHMMRMTRAAVLGVLSKPYIEMAHLKGIRQWRIIGWHALPNALSPIINVVVLNLAYLVVSVVVVEVVFVYPGLGQLLVDSVSKRDLPVVQASCLIFAATYVFLNLLADVLAFVTNPRLRHPR